MMIDITELIGVCETSVFSQGYRGQESDNFCATYLTKLSIDFDLIYTVKTF